MKYTRHVYDHGDYYLDLNDNIIEVRGPQVIYSVKLNDREWPLVDFYTDDTWLYRPIRQWVIDHCGGASFGARGNIIFYDEDQFFQFFLSWNQS